MPGVYKTLDKEIFDSDLKNTNWKEMLKIERGDVDYSFETFNIRLNEILDKHAPFKNYQSKTKNSQKTLGSLLEYLIQLKIKIGFVERS